jgi:hypothetical protein
MTNKKDRESETNIYERKKKDKMSIRGQKKTEKKSFVFRKKSFDRDQVHYLLRNDRKSRHERKNRLKN